MDKVILFGSRARGDHKYRSDIDLAVTGGDSTRFAVDADEVIRTLIMFDVVNLDGVVQEALRKAIEREGKIIYEKTRCFTTGIKPCTDLIIKNKKKNICRNYCS